MSKQLRDPGGGYKSELSQSNLTWTPTKTKDPGVSSTTNQKDLDTSREYEQPTVQLEKAQPHIQQAESRGEEAKQIGPENHSTEVWNVSLSWKITPIFFPAWKKISNDILDWVIVILNLSTMSHQISVVALQA